MVVVIIFVIYKNIQENRIGAATLNPEAVVNLYNTKPDRRKLFQQMSKGDAEALQILERLGILNLRYEHVDLSKLIQLDITGFKITLLYRAVGRDIMKLAYATASNQELRKLLQHIASQIEFEELERAELTRLAAQAKHERETAPITRSVRPILQPEPPKVEPQVLPTLPNAWVLTHEKINDIKFGITKCTELIQVIGHPRETRKHTPFTYICDYGSISFIADTTTAIVGLAFNTNSKIRLERRAETLVFDKPAKLFVLMDYLWSPQNIAEAFKRQNDKGIFMFSGDDGDKAERFICLTHINNVVNNLGHSLIENVEFYAVGNRLMPKY